jgi:amino acid adenylation domain-containing protein
LELPTDRLRPAEQSFKGARQSLALGQELSRSLEVLSRERGVTLFMTLLATFQTLLHRYTGQTDIIVGSLVANRTRPEIEDLIGLFANTLVLRTDLSGNPRFCELLDRVKETTLGAFAHQDVPFEKLVEELQPERDLSYAPLFQVVFVLQNMPLPALELRGLNLSLIEMDPGTAKFDLEFSVMETAEGLRAWIEYNTDLFDEVTINRMFGHYRRLLDGILANSQKRLLEASLLTEAEHRQMLVEWNATQRDYPQDSCFHQLFEAQVEMRPDAIAAVFEQNHLTYQELNRRANQLARVLIEQGVGPEVLVAVLARRRIEFLISMLAIFKAGGTYLPLDPRHPAQRIGQALNQCRTPIILTASEYLPLAAQAGSTLNGAGRPRALCLEDALRGSGLEENLGRPVAPRQLAYVIFTSGSTGVPKGVMIEHEGMLNHLFAKVQELELSEGDRVAQIASQCFDISVWQFLAAALVGGEAHIFDDEVTRDPAELLKGIEREGVSIVEVVPSMMRMMLAEVRESGRKPGLGSVRCVIPTGEALPVEVCQNWFAEYPGVPLLNAYGPTECSDDVTHYRIRGKLGEEERRVPIGRPIGNTRIYVLNKELEAQPIGVSGELCVGGVGVGRGYLSEGGKTAEAFVPSGHGEVAGGRLYRSGDLARYGSEGKLEYLGRMDQQVKIRGFRIELGEIESVFGRHPRIREAVVEARGEGEGEKRLTAYVVWKEGEKGEIKELREWLKGQLPEYMAPAGYVVMEKLPLTENGKLDRRGLPEPEREEEVRERSVEGPRTESEERMREIWSEVLGVGKVGVEENFFDLGGHSLLATQVMSRVRREFEVEVALRELFENPTIRELSRRVEREREGGRRREEAVLVRRGREGRTPLSFAQQRLWFLDQMEPNNAFYNIPGAIRLEGELDMEALEKAINEIERRHEVLRTRIEVEEGEPWQVVEEWEERRIEREDLRSLGEGEREEEVRRRAREEAGIGFDLKRGRLLRVKVLKLEERLHVALLTMHHIVSDGWSIGILIREIGRLYKAYVSGEESPLEELPIQYADFAAWQREYLTGDVLKSHLAYWKKQLGGKLPVLNLPTDHPHPSVSSYRGAAKSFLLPEELCQSLRDLSRREGMTLFMTLLAAFKTLLYRYTAQEDIIVGAAVANRNRAEIEPLIGFFVNMLPMRTDLSGNPRFRELLKRVKETALGGYAHQDIPFEKLIEEIQPERSVKQTPLFNVAFGVQNAPIENLKLNDIKIESVPIGQEVARFDLVLWVTESVEGIGCRWTYSKDLFEEATVRRMNSQFETLLFSIVDRPDARLTTLDLTSQPTNGLDSRKQEDIEGSDIQKLISRRKGINLPHKPV